LWSPKTLRAFLSVPAMQQRGIATGWVDLGTLPPLLPRTDFGNRPKPTRSWLRGERGTTLCTELGLCIVAICRPTCTLYFYNEIEQVVYVSRGLRICHVIGCSVLQYWTLMRFCYVPVITKNCLLQVMVLWSPKMPFPLQNTEYRFMLTIQRRNF